MKNKTNGQPRAKTERPLPCPFCGGKVKIGFVSRSAAMPEITHSYYSVECDWKNNCPSFPQAFGYTKDAAIASWNTRSGLAMSLWMARDKKGGAK